VLKKSDFTGERNFAAALVRASQIHMGDRITNAISNGWSSQPLYVALHRRKLASIGVPRDSAVISFLSFSTLSALSGHRCRRLRRLLSG
jgi:hypothetical protein